MLVPEESISRCLLYEFALAHSLGWDDGEIFAHHSGIHQLLSEEPLISQRVLQISLKDE